MAQALGTVSREWAGHRETLEGLTKDLAELTGPAARLGRQVVAPVTPLGWTVLTAAAFSWLVGSTLGWVEALYVSAACLLMFALCGLLTLGRTLLRVVVDVAPCRVVVGDAAAGRVEVTNISRTPRLPIALEVPIGVSEARFRLPPMAAGKSHEEVFIIPTTHRGVIAVGPATTVRGDPFGLLGRAVRWTGVTEIFVHPVTVPLESLGSGLLRDLEGQTTNDISMSDLAFHTLRDYAPGDDRRYIHWRSSAKVAAQQPGGKFLVRQFLDSRRSHLAVVVDTNLTSYTDVEEFETAISVGASVASRVIRDEMDTTLVVGTNVAHKAPLHLTLDTFARAEAGQTSLVAGAAKAVRIAPETSVAIIVTGLAPPFGDLLRAAAQYGPEVNVVVIRVNPHAGPGVSGNARLKILNLSELKDLPTLLRGANLQ
jgi:uncharacterized protein (DUF58 family)